MMKIFFAPLQGYTDYLFRRIHFELVGGVDAYFTPFLRWDGDKLRNKDLRDVLPENNVGVDVVPQIIAADTEELAHLLDVVRDLGYKRVDLNLGCPFPLQTGRGRGSALLAYPERVEAIMQKIMQSDFFEVSVKMRSGFTSPDEGLRVIDVLNDFNLTFVCVHARLGKDQYRGSVDMDAFARMKEKSTNKVVFNGDITSVGQIKNIANSFPDLEGVMIGRGLLARPTLAHEWREGLLMSDVESMQVSMAMHGRLYDEACRMLQGDQQILGRMRAFWEYQQPLLDRKIYKRLMKAGNQKNYELAVRSIG